MHAAFCSMPSRRFASLGAAFLLIGVQAPGFLPVGLVFLVLAWRHRQQGR